MSYSTLKVARANVANFVPALRKRHNHVRLLNGRWCNVLGAPGPNCVHVRGNLWHVVGASE